MHLPLASADRGDFPHPFTGKKSPNPFPELTASPAIVHPPEFTLTAGMNPSHFHKPEPLLRSLRLRIKHVVFAEPFLWLETGEHSSRILLRHAFELKKSGIC